MAAELFPSLTKLLEDVQIVVETGCSDFSKDQRYLEEVIKEVRAGISKAIGNALHRLEHSEPSIDAVKKLVSAFPDAMKVTKDGRLPVTTNAINNDSTKKFVPVLAMEGQKHDIGGENMRGGLLCEVMEVSKGLTVNTLQLSVGLNYPCDDEAIKNLNELKEANLLTKQDIINYDLFYWSFHWGGRKQFYDLINWDSDAFVNATFQGNPLIHAIIERTAWDERKDLQDFLSVSFQYIPECVGHLFERDNRNHSALSKLFRKIGKNETMKILKAVIKPKYPIIHQIVQQAPHHKPLFLLWFQEALHIRDDKGRTVQQAALVSGAKSILENQELIMLMTSDQLMEVDPVLNFFPFAVVAVGESGDLNTSYYLLRKCPSVLEFMFERQKEIDKSSSLKGKCRKRQRYPNL